jgi:hypothetical protein
VSGSERVNPPVGVEPDSPLAAHSGRASATQGKLAARPNVANRVHSRYRDAVKRHALIVGAVASLAAAGWQTASRAAGPRASKLTVYHVRDNIETIAALTPAALMSFASVRKYVRRKPSAIAAALAAVYAAAPTPRNESAEDVDVRWGLVFAYPDGHEFSVFCDSFASAAIVDGAARTFRHHTLAAWLTTHYGPA